MTMPSSRPTAIRASFTSPRPFAQRVDRRDARGLLAGRWLRPCYLRLSRGRVARVCQWGRDRDYGPRVGSTARGRARHRPTHSHSAPAYETALGSLLRTRGRRGDPQSLGTGPNRRASQPSPPPRTTALPGSFGVTGVLFRAREAPPAPAEGKRWFPVGPRASVCAWRKWRRAPGGGGPSPPPERRLTARDDQEAKEAIKERFEAEKKALYLLAGARGRHRRARRKAATHGPGRRARRCRLYRRGEMPRRRPRRARRAPALPDHTPP